MDILDDYYGLNEDQQKQINIQASIDAGYLIDIQGRRYTGELQSALEMQTQKIYAIYRETIQKIEPTLKNGKDR